MQTSDMTKPDIKKYNSDPAYLRLLVTESGLSQKQAAKAIGHNERTMRYWLSGKHTFAYSVQYSLEKLIGRPAVERARAEYKAMP